MRKRKSPETDALFTAKETSKGLGRKTITLTFAITGGF